MDDKPKPGEQMARVDEATLQELIHITWNFPANWERVSGACISVASWPNTDPTLTAFYAPKEDKPNAPEAR